MFIPKKGTALHTLQSKVFEEYGLKCHIVKESSWGEAFTYKGEIYAVETISEDSLKDVVPHEGTHAMLQAKFKPYLDFVERTPDISGEGYMRKKTRSVGLFLSSIFTGLLTVSVAITLTSDITFARVMYTAFKVVVLLFRMAQGYQMGAKAYNSVEVRQLKAKSNYLRLYLRFVEEQTYLKLGDKYGDIEVYLSKVNEDLPEVETARINEKQDVCT